MNATSVLYHFSEDPAIERFVPRVAPSSVLREEFVWAVDAEHAHLYYFPRDCPRVHFCSMGETTAADIERFLGLTTARHVAAIEAAWLPRLRSTAVYRYELPGDSFELIDRYAGYWTSRETVTPLSVEPVGDLLDMLVAAGVELRVMPSLWPLRDAVIASTLQFSIIRWRNAAPPPEAVLEGTMQ
jgi:hypothetical protein